MNVNEFSDMFDTLLNSYSQQAEFGESAAKVDIVLDEYEKSVLLTLAQDIVVKSFFDKKLNSEGSGFDDSTKRQIDFSSLIKANIVYTSSDLSSKFDKRGILYDMPLDILFILNERLETLATSNGKSIEKSYVVVPLNYKEYDREMSKPYSQPLKKQAWRLFLNPNTGFDFKSELIPIWNTASAERITAYRIRYIRRPRPIVLINLPDELSVDGVTTATDCELNPVLHPEILLKAVELAVATRGRLPLKTSSRDNQ